MASKEFERYRNMIAAAESDDDKTLGTLIMEDTVKEDKVLAAYARALEVAAYITNPALVKKLLEHPFLNQRSEPYKRVVSSVYSQYGADKHGSPNPEILKLLLDKFKDDRWFMTQTLSSIFSAAVDNYNVFSPAKDDYILSNQANADAARMLVENGANITRILSDEKAQIESQQRVVTAKRAALSRFTAKVVGTNQ